MNKINLKFETTIIIVLFLFAPCYVFAKIPSDPFAEQWAYKDIGLYSAWDTTVGSREVVVAIIDNGFDTYHPDLMDNIWINNREVPNNYVDDDNNGYVDDVSGWNFLSEDINGDGEVDDYEKLGNNDPRPDIENVSDSQKDENIFSHGTIVAGLIGAVGNNGLDGTGVNWQVKLMNLKVVNNSGYGSFMQLARAIHYAVDNGASVINVSMVSSEDDDQLRESIHYAYQKGVAIFAASGNNAFSLNDAPLYPICMDSGLEENWLLGVSAIGENHRLASFSNTGSSCIDITAPGIHISSTVRFSPTNGLNDRYMGGWNGTSFATPLVSGAAALIKSIQPNWGAKEIYLAILSTVYHTPNNDEAGYAEFFGKGLLQIDKAIAYAKERINSVNKISKINLVDLSNGIFLTREISSEIEIKNNQPVLQAGLDFAIGKVDEKSYYAVLKKDKKKLFIVEIYDELWNKVKSVETKLKGDWQVTLADISGDNRLEIILTNRAVGKEVYYIYNWNGKKISEHQINKNHQGVAVAIGRNDVTKKADLVLAYNDGGSSALRQAQGGEENRTINTQSKLKIKRFTSDGTVKDVGQLNDLKLIGSLGVGDINGDGREEYVVSGQKNEGNILVYYNSDGSFNRSFSPYDVITNMSFVIGDYDKDNKDDIIILPAKSGLPIKVWTGKVKKIAEWNVDEEMKGRKMIFAH